MLISDKERLLRIKRRDWVWGKVGVGVSLHPFVLVGAQFALKWWPCTQALAFQASIMQFQFYVCYMRYPNGDPDINRTLAGDAAVSCGRNNDMGAGC